MNTEIGVITTEKEKKKKKSHNRKLTLEKRI